MEFPASNLAARQSSLQEVDRTMAITVASWTLMFITVVAFAARQITKAITRRRFAIDDAFALTATAFAVGLSITAIVLASLGLGVQETLTTKRANMFMKGHYASELLYILATCFSKLSILVIFYTGFEKMQAHRRSVFTFGCFIFAWSIASILAVAVQCALPRPWNKMTFQCFDTRTFWTTYCIIDSVTELLIIASSILLVAYLQIEVVRKVVIVACFASRAFVICSAILRLMWLYPSSPHQQPEFQLWLPTIMTQVQVCLNLCTACIPYIVPLLWTTEGNLWRSNTTSSQKDHSNESHGRIGSSLWFRRHRSRGIREIRDSTDCSHVGYKRVSYVSPYLATPRPTSPMTPPQVRSPMIRSSSKNGLCISIPLAQRRPEYDMLSSRTASSSALSPTCASPQPLLTPFIAARKAPSPPPKAYTPGLGSADLHSASNSSKKQDTPRSGHFSLFPSQRAGYNSPQPRQTPINSPPMAPIRSMQPPIPSSGLSSPPFTTSKPAPQLNIQPLKFSTTPTPQSILPLPAEKQPRPASVQDLNSPMGAALNNFFGSSADGSPGGYVKNQQYLMPFTPIKETAPGLNVSRASRNVQRDELFLPAMLSREGPIPVIGHVRSKANVTVVPRSM